MGWGITFCIMQAIAVALGFLGMAPDDILSPIILNAVLTACAWASFARDITWARIESYMRFGDELAARTFRPDCGGCDKYDACAHRITRDEDLSRIGRLGRKLRGRAHELRVALHRPTVVCVRLLLLAGLFAMLDLFQRRGGAPAFIAFLCWGIGMAQFFVITFKSMPIQPADLSALGTAAAVSGGFTGIGMAQFFVITFKSMPIQPADLSALGTAAAVSGGFTYIFSAFGLYGMALLAISMLLCSLAGAFRPEPAKRNRRLFLTNLLIGALCLVGVGAHVTLIDYYNTLNITVYTWRPLESYYRQGFERRLHLHL